MSCRSPARATISTSARRQAEREREAAARRTHALGVAARVDVLRLERVRQPEQRLVDAALQLLVQHAHVFGVAQRLLIRGVEAAVGRGEIVAARGV